MLLKAGDMVVADGRLLEGTDLEIDESSLTGESEPTSKDPLYVIEGKVSLGDQHNMVFSGCLVTSGVGTFVVTAIGMKTQMGKIAGYLNDTQKIKTPLQLRLEKIGKLITLIAVLSAIFLFMIGTAQGEEIWSMILLAVSLAVAAVPETLSLIVTLTLAHGVETMVSKNAIIRKLSAVETLGSTSVICSDKTGTLTQNRMTIKKLWFLSEDIVQDTDEFSENQYTFLKKLALTSNAVVEHAEDGSKKYIGDPTEKAIIRLLEDKGLDKSELTKQMPREKEIPFSSSRKRMTVVIDDPNGGYMVLTKGAFDWLPINMADTQCLEAARKTHDSFAQEALRVIALGEKHIDELPPDEDLETLEKDLTLVGLIGIIDPPRPESAQAIRAARKAGIRTVMITGDHVETAKAIAKQIGILSDTQKVLTGQQLAEMSDQELCDTVDEYSV